MLSKDIFIITTSPEQYNDEFTTEEETREESEYERRIVVSDNILNYTEKQVDPFFARGRHEDLDYYNLSQVYFDLPNRKKEITVTQLLC